MRAIQAAKGGGDVTERRQDVIWLRPAQAAVGRPAERSRAQITAAAIGLADRGGLDALSMRRLAAEHVGDRIGPNLALGTRLRALYSAVKRGRDAELPHRRTGRRVMAEARRSVRMSEDETWQMLEQSVNGILTTLRRDGRPVALPIWYVVLDRRIYMNTRGRKVERARHDPRASFLVEAGERWADLRAVHLEGTINVIEPDPDLAERIRAGLDAKYAALRVARAAMPAATQADYARRQEAVLELVPEGKILTWDNRHLGLE
jgi:hypothetical protein